MLDSFDLIRLPRSSTSTPAGLGGKLIKARQLHRSRLSPFPATDVETSSQTRHIPISTTSQGFPIP